MESMLAACRESRRVRTDEDAYARIETFRVVRHPACPWCRTGIRASVCEAMIPDMSEDIRKHFAAGRGKLYEVESFLPGAQREHTALTAVPDLLNAARSVRELGRPVREARARLTRMRAEVEQHTRQQIDDLGLLHGYLDGDQITRARDAYLDHIDRATTQFLQACDGMLHIHEEFTRELRAALDTAEDPDTPGAGYRACTELAARYAEHIEQSRREFFAACEAQQSDFAFYQAAFTEIVSQRYNVAVDVLDTAIYVGVQAGAVAGSAVVLGTGAAVIGAGMTATAIGVALLTGAAVGVGAVGLGLFAVQQTAATIWEGTYGNRR
ncbi:hypothetical protein AB0N09_37930 [Streptomyces erythrochromogenes]|uniref:hypothetical protein n=1 Tax=Streptomyces erythrochromogenes TaxID=285574 RepID=UPI003444FC49